MLTLHCFRLDLPKLLPNVCAMTSRTAPAPAQIALSLPAVATARSLDRTSSQPLPSLSSSSSSALASPTSRSPSIRVTCRILALLTALRKKVTKHVNVRRLRKVRNAKARRAFCQDIKVQACEEIDKYLGRIKEYPRRHLSGTKRHTSPPDERCVSSNRDDTAESDTNRHVDR